MRQRGDILPYKEEYRLVVFRLVNPYLMVFHRNS